MQNLHVDYLNSVKDKQVLTLSKCIKIVLKNGEKLGFTTHTKNVVFDDENDIIYLSKGLTPTATTISSAFNIDNLDNDILLDNENIKAEDLESGRFNGAYFEFFDFNWLLKPFLKTKTRPILSGYFGDIERTENKFKTTCVSLSSHLQQNITDLYKPNCSFIFGDINTCKKDLSLLTFTDTIASVNSQSNFTLSTLTNPDNFFNDGVIIINSGLAINQKIEVKQWIQSTKNVIMQVAFTKPIAVGDNITIIAGCNKTFGACKNYNNARNFGGFPYIPGADWLQSGKK